MRAFVTGGGRVIGAGIARALASEGWELPVIPASPPNFKAVTQMAGDRVRLLKRRCRLSSLVGTERRENRWAR